MGKKGLCIQSPPGCVCKPGSTACKHKQWDGSGRTDIHILQDRSHPGTPMDMWHGAQGTRCWLFRRNKRQKGCAKQENKPAQLFLLAGSTEVFVSCSSQNSERFIPAKGCAFLLVCFSIRLVFPVLTQPGMHLHEVLNCQASHFCQTLWAWTPQNQGAAQHPVLPT